MTALQRHFAFGVAAFLLTTAFSAAPQVGAPDVNLSPKRIVVADGSREGQEVIVFNRGTATATYAVSLVDRRMTTDGQLLQVDEPGAFENSAGAMIRYSPRRVTLEPGQSQVVRLQVRRPSGLADGEYRSHLTVSAIPPADAGLTIDALAGAAAPEGIEVRITPVYGVSIPVIIRQGAVMASVAISSVSRSAGEPSLRVDFTRMGARSVYGDVVVRRDGPEGPVVGELRGVGIYPEVDTRHVVLPLSPEADLPAGTTVHVTYVDRDGADAILATASATL